MVFPHTLWSCFLLLLENKLLPLGYMSVYIMSVIVNDGGQNI